MKKASLFDKVLLGILLTMLLGFVYLRFGVLRPWLRQFEASQPKYASQEVFDGLFAPADWGRVCELAGLEGNWERAARVLEERTAGRKLTMVETSAGLSGDRRYIVKAGSEGVAAFTLANRGGARGAVWEPDAVELLIDLEPEAVLIRALEGQRVRVDGKELGENCQIQTTQTLAERYLPEGVHGRRTVLWRAQGEEISVLDGENKPVPVAWDEENGCYAVEAAVDEPTEEERSLLIGAAKTYARYMIRESNTAQLQQYFDSGSAIYKTIRSSETWMQQNAGYSFSGESISGFCRYGEKFFSARVSLRMDVKRGNGSAKPYQVDSTFFFRAADRGWRVFEMTNVDAQNETVFSRLTFMDGERELCSIFASSEERGFTPPSAPERPGQRFAGWAVREREGDQVTMTVRFRPDGNGKVTLPAGYVLEPATLYAVFEEV